jgi:hypothetical protein
MSPLLKKLNYKGQSTVFLFSCPAEAEHLFMSESVVTTSKTIPTSAQIEFAVAFTTTLDEVDAVAQCFQSCTTGDATVWIAYPKASSKKFKCEFNRDTGWHAMGDAGFEPVRQVAIDEDWSALRFRRVEYIKTMTRSFAMTEEGKAKATK